MKLYPPDIDKSLDFDFLKKTLAEHCSTALARQKVFALRPSADDKLLRQKLQTTDEVLQRYQAGESFPSTQFEEIELFAQRLKTKGSMLEEENFALIRSTLITYTHLFVYLKKQRELMPAVYQLVQEVEPLPQLVNAIDKRIDERGEVRSNASKALGQIRAKLVSSRASAARIFDRMVKKYRDKGYLADFDESISENRRVLAIQSSYKGLVQGIFHGSSSKNSIVYIEPGETVEINNELAQLQDDERQEIRRILRELSEELRPSASYLIAVEKLLAELDFIKAKALFARHEDCCLPLIANSPRQLELVNAYNPVLRILNRGKEKDTIPLQLQLHSEQRLLVISGPNAGGKSIALKTLGLLNLMLQCGLLVPVDPGSKMCFFNQLFADIGDNQSIENELSTYSSKLQKMKHFLAEADQNTLLLIDEFGSGSDPDLGSALAQVFMEKLNSYGIYGIFTTHYSAIKALAARLDGVSNAAMLFDKRSLQPEYLLQIGNPGSSYTFEVAGNSGIAPHIIKEAREKTAEAVIKMDQLLVQLQDDKLQLEKKHRRLNKDLSQLKKLEQERENTIARLEEKLSKQSRLNEESDRLIHWGQRFQKLVESWMDQQSQKDKKQVVARFIGMLNQRSSEVEQEEKKEISSSQSRRDKQLLALKAEELSEGDKVKLLDNGIEGVISEIKKDKYLITLGNNITTWVDRDRFIRANARLNSIPKKKRRKKNFNPKEGKAAKEPQKEPSKPAKGKSKN